MTESAVLPIPTGWFCVARSHELQPGQVRAIEAFGQKLALFRTREGNARVLDAHCPHLGAHLAHPITGGEGGKVVGNSIRCPFHDWEWDGSTGACSKIPYAKKIPPNASTRAWETVERGGLVMVWHDPQAKPPSFELPMVPELEGGDFEVVYSNERVTTSTPFDMGENSVDLAHFVSVHGLTEYPDGSKTEVVRDGHRMTITGPAEGEMGGESPLPVILERSFYGLGFVTIRFRGIPGADPILLITTTPLDERNVAMRWTFFAEGPLAETLGVAFADQLMNGVLPDMPIWENKVYVPNPILCDGDGPIGEYRRWALQFHGDA